MARYAVLIYANDPAHDQDEVLRNAAAHEHHSAQLRGSGSTVAAYALEPPELATSISDDTITDGPFLDAKEIVAGFYVLEAPDLDAALAIARLNPAAQQGGAVEVRPVANGVVTRDGG